MKLLLSKGVDVESESDAGTPLMWAAGHAQQAAVKILLEHNAKVSRPSILLLLTNLYCMPN
jgi:ankyrin repeat protein